MRPYTLSRIRGCASVRLGPKASAPFRLAAHAAFCGFALRKGWPLSRSCSFLRLRLTKRLAAWPLMQLSAASPYEKGNRSCVLEFLPYEKFLALWRGSLPADLVYELQFSFNFQLPVFKDRTRLRSESFGKVKCLRYSLLAEP